MLIHLHTRETKVESTMIENEGVFLPKGILSHVVFPYCTRMNGQQTLNVQNVLSEFFLPSQLLVLGFPLHRESILDQSLEMFICRRQVSWPAWQLRQSLELENDHRHHHHHHHHHHHEAGEYLRIFPPPTFTACKDLRLTGESDSSAENNSSWLD